MNKHEYGNKSVSMSFMSLWAKGSWVLWGYWGPLNFFPNSRKVKTRRTCLLDIVGNNLRCTNQVDEVREEQLDRGRCQALLWIRVSTPVKELKGSSLTRGH